MANWQGDPNVGVDRQWRTGEDPVVESVQSYSDLIIWQQAVDLVPVVYRLMEQFPKLETYALADQLRRAAVSIPANIAEGQARGYTKEFLHHLRIAKGSLAELDTLLLIGERLAYLESEDLAAVRGRIGHLGRALNGMIASLKRRTSPRTTAH